MRWWLLPVLGIPALAAWWFLAPQAFHIPTGSMEPTLEVGDRVIATMSHYRRQAPRRGDVVIFRSPENPELLQVSRVLALGGETIEIVDKEVRIDGEPLEDPWGVHLDSMTFRTSRTGNPFLRRDQLPQLRVPEGSVFVLSDNRDRAHDSRFQGPIPVDNLVGRPLFVYWGESSGRIGQKVE